MFKQKRDKFTVTAIPEKLSPEKPFVQVEAELTEAQLEALADGLMKLTTLYTSFKEELMSIQQQDKFTAGATPEKPRPEKPLVQLEGELTPSSIGDDLEEMILLANVLQAILHKVLPKAKVKIFHLCNTNNFSKDYFRQQYQRSAFGSALVVQSMLYVVVVVERQD